MAAHILISTFGSFGDLHPYLAVGLRLKERGHRVTVATCALYRDKVEGEGLGFHAIRPDLPHPDEAGELMERAMDPRRGTECVIRDLVMPHVRAQFDDLEAAASGADFLLSHMITFAAPLVAEKLGLRWAATMLQPICMASAHDPPVPPALPAAAALYRLGPGVTKLMLAAARRAFRPWCAPLECLRAELGLKPGGHPLFEGQYSPFLNLALFSPALGRPQPDWPARTVQTGFPFYDRLAAGSGMPPALEAFLEAGPPPVVFTLGSSAVRIGGEFYARGAEAARRLGRRAVLLAGQVGWNRLPDPLPDCIYACEYAPHGTLFPRAAAIVHQGGVGTTAQALRAGRPMLVVPFAHDQPDNATRAARLGVARILPRGSFTAGSAARELRRLLEDPASSSRAAAVGEQVRSEDGAGAACAAIEACLRDA